jgi:hypothetical protein
METSNAPGRKRALLAHAQWVLALLLAGHLAVMTVVCVANERWVLGAFFCAGMIAWVYNGKSWYKRARERSR